jgi:GTPase SAR1 family protein
VSVMLNIWDTAGMERFRAMLPMYVSVRPIPSVSAMSNMTWDTAGMERFIAMPPCTHCPILFANSECEHGKTHPDNQIRRHMSLIPSIEAIDSAPPTHHHISNRYYRDCHAAVVMYDITRKDSFAAVPGWIVELRRNAGASAESLVIAIVGNKRDLESKREVSVEQGAALAESLRALSFETSALTVRCVHVQTHDCRMVCVCVCVCVCARARVCVRVCASHHTMPNLYSFSTFL